MFEKICEERRTDNVFSDSKGISRTLSEIGSDHVSDCRVWGVASLTEVIKFLKVLAPFLF